LNKNTNIVLIGFMGSGKTTFGKWIAKNQQYHFVDTDEYIENQQHKKISQIFEEQGEEAFRNLETDAMKELAADLEHTVLSVGGGLPMRLENRELLKKCGLVVYLRTTEDELVRRLSGDQTRPLLAGTDLRGKIHSLMMAREAMYLEAADIVIDTDGYRFEEMFEIIKEKGRNHV
jgi:shikimate kinase